MKRVEVLSLCLSVFLIIAFTTGGLFLTRSGTFVQALSPQQSINGQNTVPLDVGDSIFNENTTTFLGSKNISLTPYRMTETYYSDQGFLKGVGNVTNNQTYIDTYLSDKLVQSTGNGTFETPDGQSIAWIYSGIGKPVDDRWVFYGIRLFNNTQSESLSLLNNSIGLSKNVLGNETDYIWILK
ncbi:MAG TPA: hypothetical protein VEW92_13170 [Nitrososphaeraceae archaeon]|nr:hypothetical protein [Nitrososphaeraceae archaeon]